MGEDLVDDRLLRDEGDEAHRAGAGRTREGIDLDELQERRAAAATGSA